MSGWNIQWSYNGTLTDAEISSRNVNGSPLVSVERINQREAGSNSTPSGVFRLTMEAIDSLSVSILHFADTNSPTLFSGTKTVVADGSTPNLSIIPGLSLVLSANAVAGDIFDIGIGCFFDTDSGAWIRVLPFDLIVSGATSAERVLYAKNVSGSTQGNCQVFVTNAMRVINDQEVDDPFVAFRQTGASNPTADSDSTGRAVTFTGLVEGTPNTISILVGGVGIHVYDVTNDALISNGVGLQCDGTTVYRFDDSTDLRSGEFILATTVSESSTATIFTSDGGDFAEISDGDTAFVAGYSGIYLTDTDAPEGVVSDQVAVPFKLRMVGPSAKTTALNQRQFSIRIQSEGI